MIGAGAMATGVHYPSLATFPDVEIAGICDLDPARLTTVADRYGVAGRFSDYREMIDALAPNGVYAIGPPHLLYDAWLWCLQRGVNLFIEKPMGLTLHQARMLAHLAEERGVMTQVGHQRRASPLLVKLREECLRRGPITHAVCEFYKCDQRPFIDARDRMLDDCVHSIDTLRWMCGGEVVDVDSRCRRVGVPDINWITATIQFDNDSTGVLINSWSSGRRIFRVQLHAPAIACDADPEAVAHVYADGDSEGKAYDSRIVAGSDEFFVYGGFAAKSREFIDSLQTGTEVTGSPFRDAVKTMEVAETILARAVLAGH